MTHHSYYVVAPSGAGKTRFCRAMAMRSPLKCIAINADKSDYPESKFTFADFDALEKETASKRRMNIIIDDIVCPSEKEVRLIRGAVVYVKKHSRVSVWICSHSLRGNKLSISQAGQCDYAVFAFSLANASNFVHYMKDAAGKPKSDAERIWHNFMSENKPFTYLMYDRKSGDLTVLNSQGLPVRESKASKLDSQRKRKLKEKIERFSVGSHGDHASLLFEYIFDHVDIACVSDTLEITLRCGASKKKVSANLIDILHYVSHKDIPEESVLEQDKIVFDELRRRSFLPRSLILNPLFK